MICLGLTRAGEDSLQSDAEIEDEEGLHVQVRLAPTYIRQGSRSKGCQVCRVAVQVIVRAGQKIASWYGLIPQLGRGLNHVGVRGYFGNRQGMGLLTPSVAQGVALTDVDRRPALQVREAKGCPPIPTECGSQERKERLVLIDG
jgi:hypothetical protein